MLPRSKPAVYNTASKNLKVSYSPKCILDIETESLDPKEGRIVCVGTKDVKNGKTTIFYDGNEEEMLKAFLEYYKRMNFTEIIGYNVLFDIRFIFAKCL